MGTPVTITLCSPRRVRNRAIEDVLASVQARMDAFGRDFWAWGDGRLGEINRALSQGASPEIPADMRPLFERAQVIRAATAGLFEPRIGQLVRLWGFDDPIHLRDAPPAAAEIELRVRNLDRGLWDFGAIGKGLIVDECLDLLAARGFAQAAIDAGGNVAVRGCRGIRPWRIGIRDPRADRSDVTIAQLDAADEAVITHGDDQRFFDYEGVRYSHILDPRSGWPARGLRSVTVVHRDATLADAAGAALFVAGREWRSLAEKLELHEVMAITAEGEIEITLALARRLATAPA